MSSSTRLAWGAFAGILALAGALPATASPASGERIGGPSIPVVKALTNALTYDNFTNFNCSQSAFFTNATAHLDIQGDVVLSGTTTLDGVQYDTYALLVSPGGPDSFQTEFSRNFSPPPPASSTYTFVFNSHVLQGGRRLGVSQTTITCANGAFSAVNVWFPGDEPIPAGGPAGWAALALLLAATAAAHLARRRA